MSHDESQMPERGERIATSYLLYLAVVPLLALGAIIWVMMLGGSSPTTKTGSGPSRVEESNLESARQSLTRQTDLNTCRSALQQINEELGEKSALRPPPLTKEENDWLRQQVGLDDGEVTEVEGGNYTRLDGQHLENCFLLRDAARALELKGARAGRGGAAVREAPLDLAARAFAWVMREVQLREYSGEAVPPAFVLRRGWGRPAERALVFLALLEQLGDPETPRRNLMGCLLYVPGESGKMHFWACGVVIGEGKDVYLFDPRLGLPLPGPDGRGIATLGQVRKQPDVISQLHVEKYHYDVTAEQAREAHALLVCPLSRLAPRMRYLQQKLLAPAVRVRLATDGPVELKRLEAACAAGADKPAHVEVWKPAVGLLRRFLSPEEGGIDQGVPMALAELRGFTRPDDPAKVRMPRRERFSYELVPWTALPPQFQDNTRFPYNIGLGQRVRNYFARPFILSAQDAGHPRDLLLRGRYGTAVPALVGERERWRDVQRQRANAVDVEQGANKWLDRATHDYATQLRAETPAQREQADKQVQALWQERSAQPIYLLLGSAIASARNPEIAYLLGLCAQEQAEQLQARLDVQTKSGAVPHPSDKEKAQHAWQDALSTWQQYADDYPNRFDQPAARRMRGRAEALLGDAKAAQASWRDLSGPMTDLEKLAALLLAEQLKAPPNKAN